MVDAGKIKAYVGACFQRFGVNKQREISRLLYEIAKREGRDAASMLEEASLIDAPFSDLKRYLIARRYPAALKEERRLAPYLPGFSADAPRAARLTSPTFSPSHIYIEEGAEKTSVARRCATLFPSARRSTIRSLKEYTKERRYRPEDYDERRDALFIVRQRFDFLKDCPCTSGALGCGYRVLNIGFGCIYECTYCYLQEYSNAPGIVIPSNIEDFFDAFRRHPYHGRLGTGEFTDSLALDHITEYSPILTDFFKEYPHTLFELKTKSDNIRHLTGVAPGRNTVVAWSLNPQKIIDGDEYYSASLERRLRAASDCIKAGFAVAFHYDPIFYYKGWDRDYAELNGMLFDNIAEKHIRWISLGTFRFSRSLKKTIEKRFPKSVILDGELLPGYDGKLRYSDRTRNTIYRYMIEEIRKRSKKVYIYLCMEPKMMWKACALSLKRGWL